MTLYSSLIETSYLTYLLSNNWLELFLSQKGLLSVNQFLTCISQSQVIYNVFFLRSIEGIAST